MDLSKEQIKKILDEAPVDATHYDGYEYHGCYLWDSAFAYYCDDSSSWLDSHALNVNSEYLKKERVFNLSDLRKQLDGGRVNGDELYHTHHAYKVNPKITYVGKHPFIKGKSYCISDMDGIITVDDCYISSEKPETEAEKVERERLESAYELYMEGQYSVGVNEYDSFDQFKLGRIQVKFWLAIVDKTKYRKEVE